MDWELFCNLNSWIIVNINDIGFVDSFYIFWFVIFFDVGIKNFVFEINNFLISFKVYFM